MRHTSIPLQTPIELIDFTPLEISPLISKCQIKVCYVSEQPNRNGSVITKQVARKMAYSLRGSCIVGHFNSDKDDFEQHNRVISIGDDIKIIEDTRPYGFVDINARVWFQHFLDDDGEDREYLVTEGYLWTGQYPECRTIIENGKGQSMELDENYTDGYWTNAVNSDGEFFIINDTVISKLCILGENAEPCFEGANITNAQYSLAENDEGNNFAAQLYTLMSEIKEILSKGGKKTMYTVYAVNKGDNLYTQINDYLGTNYPGASLYGVYEEEEQKFFVAVLDDSSITRFDFTLDDENAMEVGASEPCTLEDYQKQEFTEIAEDKTDESDNNETEESVEEETVEETTDFTETQDNEIDTLRNQVSQLTSDLEAARSEYTTLKADYDALNTEIEALKQFKLEAERVKKQEMIDSFYMLSDEDKKDVVANIDTYSLDEIESRLSVICVRNKVSFAKDGEQQTGVTFNMDTNSDSDTTPSWIQAVLDTAKELNN